MPIKINPGHYTRAIVVELPDEDTGRVKVRIPEFHGPCVNGSLEGFPERYYVDDDDLPMADVCSPLGFTSAALAVNEIVYVTFPDCKIDMPLIVGTTGEMMSEESTGKVTTYSEGYVTYFGEDGNSNFVWTGGTGSGSDMVSRAQSLVGSDGSAPGDWWGYRNHWCAMFVSYVAHLLGYIGDDALKGYADQKAFGTNGIIPLHAYCPYGAMAFASKNLWVWADSGYTPRPGDIIYFDWSGGRYYKNLNNLDHVAIVEKVENGYVHTIGGNENGSGSGASYYTTSRVCKSSRPLTSNCIVGYGTPKYPTKVKPIKPSGAEEQ